MHDPTQSQDALAGLAERVEDLARVAGRQAGTLERLADEARAREARDRAGADVPLLVDLFALHADAAACAATARTKRERAAFEAVAGGLERLIAGRGGALVLPAIGEPFDAATMHAAEMRPATGPEPDRCVAAVLAPGLRLVALGRTVRPARVAVWRHKA